MTTIQEEFITECFDVLTRPTGGNIHDLIQASARPLDCVRGLLERYIPDGVIFSRGPQKYRRYYLTEEGATAGEILRIAAADIARVEARESRKAKAREATAAANPERTARRLALIADADARRAAKAKRKREYRARVKKEPNPPRLKKSNGKPEDPRKTAIQRFVASEAVIPKGVVVQRCPTPLPRFHCEPPSDGFASMGIGRYD